MSFSAKLLRLYVVFNLKADLFDYLSIFFIIFQD